MVLCLSSKKKKSWLFQCYLEFLSNESNKKEACKFRSWLICCTWDGRWQSWDVIYWQGISITAQDTSQWCCRMPQETCVSLLCFFTSCTKVLHFIVRRLLSFLVAGVNPEYEAAEKKHKWAQMLFSLSLSLCNWNALSHRQRDRVVTEYLLKWSQCVVLYSPACEILWQKV